jgi:hypothetical protein
VNGHKFSDWLKIDLKKCSKNKGIFGEAQKYRVKISNYSLSGGASPGLVRGSFSVVLAVELLVGSSAKVSVTADSSSSAETNKK